MPLYKGGHGAMAQCINWLFHSAIRADKVCLKLAPHDPKRAADYSLPETTLCFSNMASGRVRVISDQESQKNFTLN